MRDFLAVAVVALGIVLCGVVIYVMGRHPGIAVRMQGGGTTNLTQPGTEPEREPGVAKRKRTSKPQQDTSQEANLDLEKIPSPSLKVFLPHIYPAPSPDDIKAGMARDQIESAFGEPVVRTAISDQGHLEEVYVFPGKDRDKVTVAQMRDGVVTSAYARVH